MSDQQDDLLLSLQSSLRNAQHTFGSSSVQYATISQMIDGHLVKLAQRASVQKKEANPGDGEAKPWSGNLVFRVKGQ